MDRLCPWLSFIDVFCASMAPKRWADYDKIIAPKAIKAAKIQILPNAVHSLAPILFVKVHVDQNYQPSVKKNFAAETPLPHVPCSFGQGKGFASHEADPRRPAGSSR
jgi:hypothetical protein